jgi:hypothetical protein
VAKDGRIGRTAPKSRSLQPYTVILVRDVDRVRQFRIHARTFRLFVLFCLLVVGVGVAAINRYQVLYIENQELREEIRRLGEQLAVSRSKTPSPPPALEVERSYRLLAAQMDGTDPSGTAQAAGITAPEPGPASSAPPPAPAPNPTPAVETGPMETKTETAALTPPVEPPPLVAPVQPLVDASGLVFRAQGGNVLRFRFRLHNAHPENKPVTGYLFLVLGAKANLEMFLAYPEVELDKGRPVDFRKGMAFKINQYKEVEGVVNRPKETDRFDQAWVFAYSVEGELLMMKLLVSENG